MLFEVVDRFTGTCRYYNVVESLDLHVFRSTDFKCKNSSILAFCSQLLLSRIEYACRPRVNNRAKRDTVKVGPKQRVGFVEFIRGPLCSGRRYMP